MKLDAHRPPPSNSPLCVYNLSASGCLCSHAECTGSHVWLWSRMSATSAQNNLHRTRSASTPQSHPRTDGVNIHACGNRRDILLRFSMRPSSASKPALPTMLLSRWQPDGRRVCSGSSSARRGGNRPEEICLCRMNHHSRAESGKPDFTRVPDFSQVPPRGEVIRTSEYSSEPLGGES